MKLSKSQREVVDKMREGYLLHSTFMHVNGDPLTFTKVATGTVKYLLKNNIIDRAPEYPITYQLTEKYLTNGHQQG